MDLGLPALHHLIIVTEKADNVVINVHYNLCFMRRQRLLYSHCEEKPGKRKLKRNQPLDTNVPRSVLLISAPQNLGLRLRYFPG